MMILSAIKSIFDIDNVGKRWGVRILYLITVLINAAIYFNPFADSDFTALNNWMNTFYSMTEYDPEIYDSLLSTVPLSAGNIVFMVTVLIGELVYLTSAYIYASVYVRNYRLEKAAIAKKVGSDSINYAVSSLPDEPIKISKLVGRILLIVLVTSVVALPLLTISMYFLFFVLIGLPFIFTAPVAYLSGDKGLFSSIPYVCKLSRKYYFINMRSIAIVLVAVLIVDFGVPLLANFSYTAYYIVDAAVTTWLWLSIARLGALSYCTMKDYPIGGGKRNMAI
jgi:hypothetical protein